MVLVELERILHLFWIDRIYKMARANIIHCCGPKLSICCSLISIWGIIMLVSWLTLFTHLEFGLDWWRCFSAIQVHLWSSIVQSKCGVHWGHSCASRVTKQPRRTRQNRYRGFRNLVEKLLRRCGPLRRLSHLLQSTSLVQHHCQWPQMSEFYFIWNEIVAVFFLSKLIIVTFAPIWRPGCRNSKRYFGLHYFIQHLKPQSHWNIWT